MTSGGWVVTNVWKQAVHLRYRLTSSGLLRLMLVTRLTLPHFGHFNVVADWHEGLE